MKKQSRAFYYIFSSALVLCLFVRFVQLLTGIDLDTGFFLRGKGFLPFALYLMLALAGLALIAILLLDRRKATKNFDNPRKIEGRGAVLTGFAFLVAACAVFFDLLKGFNKPVRNGFLIFIMIIGIAAMLFVGYATLSKREFTKGIGFGSSVVIIYVVLKSAGLFLQYMAIASVSDYVLDISFVVFFVFFLSAAIRLVTGNVRRFISTEAFFFGFMAAILSFSRNLPELVLSLVGPSAIKAEIPQISYENLALGLVCLVMTAALYSYKEKPADDGAPLFQE